MCDVLKFRRKIPVYKAQDGEVFTSEREREVHNTKINLANSMRSMYRYYGVCPSVIDNVVNINMENAKALGLLLHSIKQDT